ncbi:hypothetical protein [Paenibacillus sp. NPDC055715]
MNNQRESFSNGIEIAVKRRLNCEEEVHFLVICERGEIQKVIYLQDKIIQNEEMTLKSLLQCFENIPVDDLCEEYFIQLLSRNKTLQEIGERLAGKILTAYYNRYYT